MTSETQLAASQRWADDAAGVIDERLYKLAQTILSHEHRLAQTTERRPEAEAELHGLATGYATTRSWPMRLPPIPDHVEDMEEWRRAETAAIVDQARIDAARYAEYHSSDADPEVRLGRAWWRWQQHRHTGWISGNECARLAADFADARSLTVTQVGAVAGRAKSWGQWLIGRGRTIDDDGNTYDLSYLHDPREPTT